MKKIDFTKYSSIEIYQMVLNRDIIKFPKGFWNKDRSIEISKYLFENILKWDKKDIETKLTFKLLIEYKVETMMEFFNDAISNLLKAVYPNYFDENYKFNQSYWRDVENVKSTIKYLLEEKYHWTKEEIKKKFNTKLFSDNGLITILNFYTLYEILELIYPGEYLKWDLFMETWSEEDYLSAIKWLIETELKWNKEQIINNLKAKTFASYGLYSIVPNRFKNAYEVMCFAYPNKDWKELKKRVERDRGNRKKLPRCQECKYCLKQDIKSHIKKYSCEKNQTRIFQKEFSRNSPMWCPKRVL